MLAAISKCKAFKTRDQEMITRGKTVDEKGTVNTILLWIHCAQEHCRGSFALSLTPSPSVTTILTSDTRD